MARYISDQNKVVLLNESGTYGTVSGNGFWIGQVTNHSISHAENKLENRYVGTANRNYDLLEQGPVDVTGTITYHVQNMRLPFWTLGSVNEIVGAGSSNHWATEINTDVWQSPFTSGTDTLNAPISFTIEDSKQAPGTGRNFIRTLNGCVPNATTISASQGEKVEVSVDYVAQSITFSSGTTTAVTQETYRPYLWSDCTLTVAGSNITTAKSVSLAINNNINAPHYLNNSRNISTPFPQNRSYALNVSLDLDSDDAAFLYETYYINNGSFNAVFDLNASSTAGSQVSTFTLSGCKIMNMENPSIVEGPTESTIEIRPQSASALAIDAGSNYNPF